MKNKSYKLKRILILFLAGAACFTMSQPLIRLPLLNYLQGQTGFILFAGFYPILTGILIAFSAGIFEESFRFFFKISFFKSVKLGIAEPLIFGLGHGLAEALILLLPYVSLVPFKNLYWGLIERILALVIHMGLSLLIWNGFQLNKKYRFLILAIIVHGLINSLIPLIGQKQIILLEALLGLIAMMFIIYMVTSKKHYPRENENEKTGFKVNFNP